MAAVFCISMNNFFVLAHIHQELFLPTL